MSAVVESSSTPVMRAPSGAVPMNVPRPDPGSSTRPLSKPSSRSPSHIAVVNSGDV